MVDLLVERETFGHGGNQEVVRPFAAAGDVELLLVTPQMQSFEAGKKAEAGEVPLSEEDVPHWDDDFPFWQSTTVELEGRTVSFRRIVMPMVENDSDMAVEVKAISLQFLNQQVQPSSVPTPFQVGFGTWTSLKLE